jgi:hypothetical protein
MQLSLEKQLVHAPLASAPHLIEAVLREHVPPNGSGSRIVLRAGGVAQAAIVGIRAIHRPADMTPRFAVHWEAEGDGPYPIFEGELHVEADEDYQTFFLTLEGGYEPPGGAAGQVFDAVIGRHVAIASARGLLQQLCTEIESLFAAEERRKPSQMPT